MHEKHPENKVLRVILRLMVVATSKVNYYNSQWNKTALSTYTSWSLVNITPFP